MKYKEVDTLRTTSMCHSSTLSGVEGIWHASRSACIRAADPCMLGTTHQNAKHEVSGTTLLQMGAFQARRAGLLRTHLARQIRHSSK